MKPGEDSGTLTRARIAAAALDLVADNGLSALAMRPLADRLQVKAASLYWHVRDRDELMDLTASALLDEVRLPAARGGWRAESLALCAALRRAVTRRRDGARILLVVPGALGRGAVHARLAATLAGAGLSDPEAQETSTMMLAAVLVSRPGPADAGATGNTRPVLVAVDSGSRGVTLRSGPPMTELFRAAPGAGGAAPAMSRGDRVVVRRLRGGRKGEVELNPAIPWRFQVQAPTWHTTLDLRGLDVREVKVDSGAARVDCILPPPQGVVPIDISSGVAGIHLRRAPGVGVVAVVSPGSLNLRLDGRTVGGLATDTRWESAPGVAGDNHYLLKVASGTVRVSLEVDAGLSPEPSPAPGVVVRAGVGAALELLLDGVELRGRSSRS